MTERYAIPVSIIDNSIGKEITVIFYADNIGAAELLVNMVRTLRQLGDGEIGYFGGSMHQSHHMAALKLINALTPCKVQQ